MSPTLRIAAILSTALTFGCSATDAPTVELTNSAGKADEVNLDFVLDAGETINLGLDCAEVDGCDIVLDFTGLVAEAVSLDVTLHRPDGFSRTNTTYFDQFGLAGTAFFGQEAGYHTVSIVNTSGVDVKLWITGRWTAMRPDTGAPIGAPCVGDEDCVEGQACLGTGVEGQTGFCTSSCADLGQYRCDQSGSSYCVPLDEAGVEAYCFKACDLMTPDCGGDHLECIDAASEAADGPIGVCTVSAAVEGMGE